MFSLSNRGQTLRNVARVFQLLEAYVSSIEETFPGERSILPHGASYHGSSVEIRVYNDNSREEYTVHVRSYYNFKIF